MGGRHGDLDYVAPRSLVGGIISCLWFHLRQPFLEVVLCDVPDASFRLGIHSQVFQNLPRSNPDLSQCGIQLDLDRNKNRTHSPSDSRRLVIVHWEEQQPHVCQWAGPEVPPWHHIWYALTPIAITLHQIVVRTTADTELPFPQAWPVTLVTANPRRRRQSRPRG